MKIKNLFLLLLLSFSFNSGASIDQELELYMKRFKLKPVEKLKGKNRFLFKAGKVLFSDNILSGNRNISCKDCHHPAKGTSDNIALSLGEGSINTDQKRKQSGSFVIRRHSPVLYNLGDPKFRHMFWDGRIFLAGSGFQTPEERFNGPTPQAAHIVGLFDHALDAQVIFPILDPKEMRGAPGTNPVADEKDNLKAWQMIFERVKNERPEVYALLRKAFPGTSSKDFNIGQVAKALSEFIKHEFQVYDTPYDRYLRGDLKALNLQAKQGLKLYLIKAKCANCHFGKHLTNHAFMNIGTPPLKGKDYPLDRGREELTRHPRHAFKFKTPGLRNVSKSAPYMHNGVFSTLEETIQHYNSVEMSLNDFWPAPDIHLPYEKELERPEDESSLKEIYASVFQPFLRRGLGLTEQEVRDLKHFLEFGLTQD